MRVLIANRGEIALRIVRACRELNIETVAAYSKVDAELRHLDLVDDAYCVSQTSYLDQQAMLVAATNTHCTAIHPGYGFLAENAEFADRVEEAGLTFIGPRGDTIAEMGDKVRGRQLASENGLLTVPGSHGTVDPAAAAEIAGKLGYPVLLKASFGGGGRGIRAVNDESELAEALGAATEEATAGFGRGEMFVEKLIRPARHVEIQVAGDGSGQAIHFGSRDCTLQRRRQKLVEEAPAPGIPEKDLEELAGKCVAFSKQIKYRGLGTLEFLYNGDQFYFIEMNTRVQVEHPVTESITGVDLVRLQLQLARGEALPNQSDVQFKGHAIECRINAEDDSGQPGIGTIEDLNWPAGPGVRVDSHLYVGYRLPHEYDALVGKIIVSDADRPAAISRMIRSLAECRLRGIVNNTGLHQGLLRTTEFRELTFDVGSLPAISTEPH